MNTESLAFIHFYSAVIFPDNAVCVFVHHFPHWSHLLPTPCVCEWYPRPLAVEAGTISLTCKPRHFISLKTGIAVIKLRV